MGDDATDVTRREGKGSGASRPQGAAPTSELARGTLVGRYVVLDKLGEGGMGVVYAAFDPDLDRKVAIKILQADPEAGSTGGDQAWLLREAQALARLAHPNVVAVHDVGTLPGDQVFVAMELVEGTTMRAWLKARARTWREVQPVMHAAGAGLAAAHAAGLVHRDFKPENVLVGADGRVRVMDFGLARLRPDDDRGDTPAQRRSDLQLDSKSPLSAELTMAGHVVGTPAYMAPEIFDGAPADARTDQFAFGVTLFEALYHVRPFAKEQLASHRSAPPKPRIPDDARVPSRLERVALRAIAIDRDTRFASMEELLAALAIDPTARRRRALAALGGVIVVGGLAAGALALGRTRGQTCKGIEQRLTGVWDDGAKQAVRAAFVATKLPFATTAYDALAHALDQYAGEWTATATASCEATRVRGEQPEDVLALRADCLDRRLDELAAFAHVLVEPSPSLVEKGAKAAAELQPIAQCSNVALLREPNQPPPELRPVVVELNRRMANTRAQTIAGNYLAAGAAAAAISRQASEVGYAPVAADAEYIRATTLLATASWVDAVKAYTTATWTAMQGRRDDIVALGALAIAQIDAQALDKFDEARVWLELGKHVGKRIGLSDPMFEIHADEVEGMVEKGRNDFAAAVAAHGRALATAERTYGRDSPLIWEIEQVYAATLVNAFAYAEAARHLEHALAMREAIVGRDHSDIALILSNLGVCYRHLHDPRARPTFERALALREKVFGKASPILVPTLDNYAEQLRQDGDIAGALAMLERGLALAAGFPGKDHPNYHILATDYAEALITAHRNADARAVLDEVLAREERTQSSTRPQTRTIRAELALAEHAWPDAARFAQLAIADYEAAAADNIALWRPLTDLARADLELGRAVEAKPLLERALAIGTRVQLGESELAPTRAALARIGHP